MNIAGTRPKLAQKLQQELVEKALNNGTAAAAAFIKDGELLVSVAAGTQNGDPAAPATTSDLYNIGSLSKVYCAMAVMKLVELGLVTLDDPVCKHLPRLKMLDERYQKITLRHCLNHSSGLPGTNFKDGFCTCPVENDNYEHNYAYFACCKLKTEPGTTSTYCNDGFTLAEMVVAALSNMSYTAFLQKYITRPLGALSAGSYESNPEQRVRIEEKGKPCEYVMILGSGGVSISVEDCARVGYAFVEPQGVLSAESLANIGSPHSAPFLQEEAPFAFGLGWDSVLFQWPGLDFGENTLIKSGGTLSFCTYMLVSKKHRLSAVISVTMDCGMEPLALLCEMCAEVLEELGCNIRTEVDVASANPQPLPAGWAEKYEGVYYNYTGGFRVTAGENSMSIDQLGAAGWQPMVPQLPFDGKLFPAGPISFDFFSNQENCYLIQEIPLGQAIFAQKIGAPPAISKGWRERIGKHYILCDANAYDLSVGKLYAGLTIVEPEDGGVLCLCMQGRMLPYACCPFFATEDNVSEMALNGSSGVGCRDIFAPFTMYKDGVEYLYDRGYTYVDGSTLPALAADTVKGGCKTVAGNTLTAAQQDNTRVILLNASLAIYYDSLDGTPVPEIADGYALLLPWKN